MNVLVESIRSKSWILKITLMSVVLGMLLAVSLKNTQQVRQETGGIRAGDMVSVIRDLRRQAKDLQSQNTDLQQKVAEYTKGGSAILSKEAREARFFAGLVAADGPGVIVTLKDSAGKITGIEGIIHDSDIRTVVNELRAAGAEAVSINDQRLVATSAIRCQGPIAVVNNAKMAAPYEIKAIGDPKTLEGALKLPQGVVDSFSADPSMISIKRENRIVVPSYTGTTDFKIARPAE